MTDPHARLSAAIEGAIHRLNEIADCHIVDGTPVDAYDRFKLNYGDLRAIRDALQSGTVAQGWQRPLATISEEEIERVAQAIERSMFAPHELPLNADLHLRYRETAVAAINAAAQPPAAPVETERKTFTIPPGYEAVRDSEGRATGEVRPQSSAETGEQP